MVYVVALVGLFGGFCAGQLLLLFMLRHKTNEDLRKDRSLRIYGLINWLVAILGMLGTLWLYKTYFPA